MKLTEYQKTQRKVARMIGMNALQNIRICISYASAEKFALDPTYLAERRAYWGYQASEDAKSAARFAFNAHPELRA